MVSAGCGGTVLGRRTLLRTDEEKFRTTLNVVLTLLTLNLIREGVAALV